jgi:hypothetical protein
MTRTRHTYAIRFAVEGGGQVKARRRSAEKAVARRLIGGAGRRGHLSAIMI